MALTNNDLRNIEKKVQIQIAYKMENNNLLIKSIKKKLEELENVEYSNRTIEQHRKIKHLNNRYNLECVKIWEKVKRMSFLDILEKM